MKRVELHLDSNSEKTAVNERNIDDPATSRFIVFTIAEGTMAEQLFSAVCQR